ncbi:alpha/beta hydrolase [Pseudomonas sp. PDM11]|uniref:alpha/beta hydrolase n=1 Tax=Pseudomonas sp. PDM11 TaxID=2769309 RepID=UPI001CE0E4A1|nr:alpha/beta hydrolase-fold protein [Pseudomonas sp. PDM11]
MNRWLSILLVLLAISGAAMAKPDLSQPLGPTLADRGSPHYRFTQQELASADGQRHYRIWIATPEKTAPRAGYPVLYLLDGNAALGALQEAQLADLARRGPPVLVFIGYATDLRFDATARAYDYTPPLPGGEPVIDDIARQRRGGGADVFLDLIEQRIKPLVQAQAPIDLTRQSLWGHSYGGLLTLHALFTRPASFQRYIAADPSLWWQGGFILQEAQAFLARPQAFDLTLLTAGAVRERPPADNNQDPQVRARLEALAALPANAAEQLAEHLAAVSRGPVRYKRYPGLSHGPMLPASLGPALRLSTGDDEAIARWASK